MANTSENESNEISTLPPNKDAFLAMPIISVAVLFFLQVVLFFLQIVWVYSISIYLLAILILMSDLIFVLLCLYFGMNYIVKKRYKSALSLILAIPIIIFALGLPGVSEWGKYARSVVYFSKFTLHEHEYVEQIKLTKPDERGFRYKEFIWSSRFGGEGLSLIYDESDELGMPQDHRSEEWWKNAGEHSHVQFEDCKNSVRIIKAHFYVVSFNCL